MTLYKLILKTKFGNIKISSNNDLIQKVSWTKSAPSNKIADNELPKVLLEARKQFLEYFKGERKKFKLRLNLEGTDFQMKVWNALVEIPYGKLSSYKDIAIKVGSPKAYRAVGMANNKNKFPIILPCHRVVGTSGKLVGYAGGLDFKSGLILLEKSNT